MNRMISIIGGDTRQLFAGQYLSKKGFDVNIFACEHGKLPLNCKRKNNIEECTEAEILILPLPVTKNGNLLNTPLSSEEIKIRDITEKITDRHKIFYGMGSSSFRKLVEAKAGYSCDYYNNEALVYKNALLTAEGLIEIILNKTPISASGMNIGITGFGRIGQLTAERLKALGAKISIFARNELQLTIAEAHGYCAVKINDLKNCIQGLDCIINTVPAPVINETVISNSDKECIFIEAASAPYGIDAEACTKHARAIIKAFSLPGKIAPKSAGFIIGETIENRIMEVI